MIRRYRKLTDAELDAVLSAADENLLECARATTRPTELLLAIMADGDKSSPSPSAEAKDTSPHPALSSGARAPVAASKPRRAGRHRADISAAGLHSPASGLLAVTIVGILTLLLSAAIRHIAFGPLPEVTSATHPQPPLVQPRDTTPAAPLSFSFSGGPEQVFFFTFAPGQHRLEESDIPLLELLRREQRELSTAVSGLSVTVDGYAGLWGRRGNLELSQERAQAVSAWLVAHGLDPARIDVRGHGYAFPLPATPTGGRPGAVVHIVFRSGYGRSRQADPGNGFQGPRPRP